MTIMITTVTVLLFMVLDLDLILFVTLILVKIVMGILKNVSMVVVPINKLKVFVLLTLNLEEIVLT